jgi:hypothetical protein
MSRTKSVDIVEKFLADYSSFPVYLAWCEVRDNIKESCQQSGEAPVQQLKAELASTVDDLQRAYAMRESPDVLNCISKLRQLSAI